MIRRIIKIDEEKCNGCGACARACHEGAIEMEGGRARLIREDYCDGLGDCLPECPCGAITFEEREAAAYDEKAVLAAKQRKDGAQAVPFSCPGMQVRRVKHEDTDKTALLQGRNTDDAVYVKDTDDAAHVKDADVTLSSQPQLAQWPCQIKLVPVSAPYFNEAHLLIAADCTAYAYADMHNRFMKGRVTLVGCPKLDAVDYSEKLTQILKNNEIASVLILRMEVPCCGGMELAVRKAVRGSGKQIPWQSVTVSVDGSILSQGYDGGM